MIHRYELHDSDGATVTLYDTDALTVTTTVNDETPEVRPFTADEIVRFEPITVAAVSQASMTQMVAESDEAVDKLVAVVEALNAITDMTNATINANPAAVIKDLARECKTIARQANREARMTSGRTEDTDTGPVTDV